MDDEESVNEMDINLVDEEEIRGDSGDKLPVSRKNKRKLNSNVWMYFTRNGKAADGIERAGCIGCKTEYKVGSTPGPRGKNYGTSHLLRHLKVCKLVSYHDVGQMIIAQDGKTQLKKIDQIKQREMLAEVIIKHDLPYNLVEYDRMKAWVNYINPEVVLPSRNTLVSDVHKVHLRERQKLRQAMANVPNRMCLTSDLWTACTTEGYICLTVHFVDENWKLNSKILNFCRMPPPHTGVELANSIYNCLKDWGIERKVFSITLDNASANDNMQEFLKEHFRLQGSLLCDGEFFHIRCSAHILNLIVQAGLAVTSESLYKIRESVKYVRGSDARMKKFQERVQEVGIVTGIGLRLDVSTRWNSTYMMLESVLQYEKAFSSLQFHDRNYTYCPSNEEWRRGEKICEFLEPFYETTNLISGSSYPTSNIYFKQVWKIECMLNLNLYNEDVVIREMATKMKKKFDKYWKVYSVVLAFGAILDPRMKLSFLKFCFSKLDPVTSTEKAKYVKDTLAKLFESYSCKPSPSGSNQSPNVISNKEPSQLKKSKFFDELKQFEIEIDNKAGKSELDLFLEESKLDYAENEDLDVLKYWKEAARRYPNLSVMARDILAIPITTVASESAFSIGSRVLTKYRSSILPEKVQTLICTRNWLHGFELNPSDEDDETQPSYSKEDSNIDIMPMPLPGSTFRSGGQSSSASLHID